MRYCRYFVSSIGEGALEGDSEQRFGPACCSLNMYNVHVAYKVTKEITERNK